jgi:hypothetical protein
VPLNKYVMRFAALLFLMFIMCGCTFVKNDGMTLVQVGGKMEDVKLSNGKSSINIRTSDNTKSFEDLATLGGNTVRSKVLYAPAISKAADLLNKTTN